MRAPTLRADELGRGRSCPACGGSKAYYAKACRHCREHPHGRHGLSYTPEYRVWQTMRLRCTVPTNPAYPDYGGRGITVCNRWLGDVAAFISDMGPKPSKAHEIDRIENGGGYWCGKCPQCVSHARPANCRWTTRKVNDRNRRSNRFLEFRGERLTVAEWSERTGLPSDTLLKRLDAGWAVERALTKPKGNTGPKRKAIVAANVRGEAREVA